MSDEQTCPSCGVAYVDHDGLIRTCAKLQAANQYHDQPTGPGIYWNGNCVMEVTQERFDRLGQVAWGHGRVYGPIPADAKGTGT